MKTVISAKDIEELLARGGDVKSLPADAILTPSAKDLLGELGRGRRGEGMTPVAAGLAGRTTAPARPLSSKSPKADLDAFYASPYCCSLKDQLCDVGRRLWQRAYVDGNGGNIAIRVGEDIALCTPTLVSKGFMKPEDMCLVDFEGNQLAGAKKRTDRKSTRLNSSHRPLSRMPSSA